MAKLSKAVQAYVDAVHALIEAEDSDNTGVIEKARAAVAAAEADLKGK
jgi:hypothetical protein